MNPKALSLLVVLATLGGTLVLPSCRKGAKQPNVGTVDCDTVCNRTFGQCAAEFFIASKAMKKEKVLLTQKVGIFPRIQKEGLDNCLRSCRSLKGKGRNAKAVNDCLKLDACGPFADCIVKLMKK